MSFYHEKLCKGLHFNVSELCRILAAEGWTIDEIEAAIIDCIRKAIATARQLDEARSK